MSTFKGIVAEFPSIRIDYFRPQPAHKTPALACFLSHVHSDHLVGLEALRAPFVFCSAATRQILLRLEKYHYRINYARGILESHNVTYKSMQRLAKPLPLETPTIIELSPGHKIRVTLFDANHCVGAVMFLIEGQGKAILYTGDIRAETWWVNSLVRNPLLLPYATGLQRLDCIYLDTTFATKSAPFRDFPSKAAGIQELLEKVKSYPDDTIFYFHSWTFGYENVWVALSAFLRSQIHLDDYRCSIYASLSNLDRDSLREGGIIYKRPRGQKCPGEIPEASVLCGFRNGNHIQPGCLTAHTNVRLHSCERGTGCPAVDADTVASVVHIVPIVSRSHGVEISEIGAGGGKGDMDQKEELETGSPADLGKLMELCSAAISDDELRLKVLNLLEQAQQKDDGKIDLDHHVGKESQEMDGELTLQSLFSVLSHQVAPAVEARNPTIRFPYSRHSSYSELCHLVGAFRPKDVYPCTVDDDNWSPSQAMRTLFGEYCSEGAFVHDVQMQEIYAARAATSRREAEALESGHDSNDSPCSSPKRTRLTQPSNSSVEEGVTIINEFFTPDQGPTNADLKHSSPKDETTYVIEDKSQNLEMGTWSETTRAREPSFSKAVPSSARFGRSSRLTNKQIAYKAAIGDGLTWAEYGGLTSAKMTDWREEEW